MRIGEQADRGGLRGLLWVFLSIAGLMAGGGCAGTSEELGTQQQSMAREIAALRSDLNAMQRDTQTRLLILERETKTAIDQTKEKDKSAMSSRKLEADTADLKRAVDRYADKTKQMLASLIQAFVDVANEMQVDAPRIPEQKSLQETPQHEMPPRDQRSDQRPLEPRR